MNRKLLIGGGLAALALFVVAYVASPLMAMGRLEAAVKSGDRDRMEAVIDFPSVRENLRTDLNSAMLERMNSDPELRDNPFAALGMALVPALVDRLVDLAVTPQGIQRMVEGDVRIETGKSRKDTAPVKAMDEPETSWRYKSLDRFLVIQKNDDAELTWVFARDGLFTWKLVRVELPKDLLKHAG